MVSFTLNEDRFLIESYDQAKPFASFLPGIAGVYGMPMWVYYVNRGQLISSFGMETKDGAILDFTPANLSYRRTEIAGFRTFIKIDHKLYECFKSSNQTKRVMAIEKNAVSLTETFDDFEIEVKYFTVSNRTFPGLIRKVSIKNFGKSKQVELIDGLATFWPYGTNSYVTKNMSNLAVAWFDVFNEDMKMPFMRNRSTSEDTAEVEDVTIGNFYLSVDRHKRLTPIYDPTAIFGEDTGLSHPLIFEQDSLESILSRDQVKVNQLLSAFSSNRFELNDDYCHYSLYGQYHDMDALNELASAFDFDYFETLEKEAKLLEKSITRPFESVTRYPMFDQYMKSTFMDNLLRGGYPLVFDGKEGPIVYHVFSRIHGDMEREYNQFFVEKSFFSHGNGSYRDVNQNRRSDIFFVKEAGLFNIKQFLDLIQTDGHNPLSIQGSTMQFMGRYEDIKKHLNKDSKALKQLLSTSFTPGALASLLSQEQLVSMDQIESVIKEILASSIQSIESVYGTGYWSDHWIYNLDLLDSYLAIYPDKVKSLLLDEKSRFYQSHVSAYNIDTKYVLNKHGKPRQLGTIFDDHLKIEKTNLQVGKTNFEKTPDHQIAYVNVLSKYLHLIAIKASSLDPEQMGIMMDAEKPGWNDAMNGLPALFGSGLAETVSLRRLVKTMIILIDSLHIKEVLVNALINQFLHDVSLALSEGFDSYVGLRESFVEKTRYVMDMKEVSISINELTNDLKRIEDILDQSIIKAEALGKGLLPTYLVYEATSYEKNGLTHPELGLPCIKVNRWQVRALPYFLEGPATYLKTITDHDKAKAIYDHVKQTEMYDRKLKIYRTSESIDQETLEIGRIRAFTKGWLERESSFMHMGFKYLIGLLKSGLYDEYFEDVMHALPPFMDPKVYGRSTLENASFIATSNNPNPMNHGRSFVARLTGTTAEALTLFYLMMCGKHPFTYDGELHFQVKPILRKDFFKDQKVRFRLFDHVMIDVINPLDKNTYDLAPIRYELTNEVVTIQVDGDRVSGSLAHDIRNLKFNHITVVLGKD